MYKELEHIEFGNHLRINSENKENWVKMAEEGTKRYSKGNIRYLKFGQKLVYFAVVFILVFILIVKIAECFETWLRHPTYIETQIVAQPKGLFPAMTICPVKDGYNKTVLEVNRKYCIHICM